jgi:hypothetical protein
LGKLYECLKKYSEEFKQKFEQDPTIKWNQKKCFGEHYTWFNNNRRYTKNTNNQYDSSFINRFLELKEKFLKLQEDERRLKKTIVELKNDNMSTNDVDMDDDDIEQESVITMTSNINDDQESSRKRKRGALEEDDVPTTTRRGPRPRRIGYSVNDLLSDEETYFYLLQYGKTDVYKGGWSSCMKRRLSEINDTARRSLAIKFPDSHCIFDVIYTKKFESQQDAHDYEQRFFGEIEVEEFVRRLDGEFYDIPSQTIDKILRDDNRMSK